MAAYTYILGLWKAKARTLSFATVYGETDWKNDDLERLLAALGLVGINWSGRDGLEFAKDCSMDRPLIQIWSARVRLSPLVQELHFNYGWHRLVSLTSTISNIQELSSEIPDC